MKNKDIYMKLLLYSSCLLMLIGGIRTATVILNRIMLSLPMSILIFVTGALFYITYKNLSRKN